MAKRWFKSQNVAGPSHKAPARLGSSGLALLGASRKWGRKKGKNKMSYLNSVTIIGFVGADPEQRESRANGAPFTVLSVATRRSWKNAEGEWQSRTDWHRVVCFNRMNDPAAALRRGDHVFIAGSLVSSQYERDGAKGKKTVAVKPPSWQIRASVLRKLNRVPREQEAAASGSSQDSDAVPF